MITVRNRTLIVPEGERVIGTDYDNNSEVRQFRVEKAPGGIDISHLAFRLDLMYQGEIYDTCKLEKEEREDSMILAWTVAATNVAHPGTVWISLRAIDDAGTVKWGSNAAALYVQSSVNTPSHASGMTELEEHEKKMEDLLLKSEEAVSRANNATSKAETAIQTTTEAVKTAQTAATSAGSSADLAEAWAHGKKGYTAQTNDNAMYWSEQSKKRAESAKEQADLAKIYADSIAPLMDRGEYSSGTTYQENDLVKYQNAIWRCKIDGSASVPQEGENWTLFFRGVQSINELVAADAQGLLGQAGAQQVNAQALIDAVAEKIATKLLLKSDVVSQLVNDATKAASSAAVYALQQKLGTGDLPNGMSDVVAGLTALNSDLALYNNPAITILTKGSNKIADSEFSAYMVKSSKKTYFCFGFVKVIDTLFADDKIFVAPLNTIPYSSLVFYGATNGVLSPLLYKNGYFVIPNMHQLTTDYYYVSGSFAVK